jgi:hypothetical protein
VTFLVEDGTGLATATAGTSVAFADDYFNDRQIQEWANLETATKQACLIKATDYVEYRWASRFDGDPVTLDPAQALSFPRNVIAKRSPNAVAYGYNGGTVVSYLQAPVVNIGVPILYQKAIAEYALRAATAPLAADPTVTPSGRLLVSEKHSIGPIEDSYAYAQYGAGNSVQLFRPYPAADALLQPLLRRASGLIR